MKKAAQARPNQLLKGERELRGWSQKYVAEQIGADHYYVSRWERGTAFPSLYYRRKLCALFGKDARELGLLPEEHDESTGGPEASTKQPSPGQLSPSGLPSSIHDPAIPLPPTGVAGLVGRNGLLRQLKQRLCNSNGLVLTALNGLPGVGKTTLAVALAHDRDVLEHFPDGILWTALGPHPNVLALLSRWGGLLGLPPSEVARLTGVEAWIKALRAAIGTRRMLLIIDDAWRIEDAQAFKVGGPYCAYLVTTRFPGISLQFASEGATVVRELSENDGVELLSRLAPRAVENDPKMAHTLVQSVGALPLALTIIGNYLRTQAHSGQPRRLRAAMERLQNVEERLRLSEPLALLERSPNLPQETPLSLQAVIEVGDHYLDEQAKSALRALSLFPARPDSFSEEAALAVSGAPVEALDALTDAGFLEGSGPDRYTLHQTIADYARSHLTDGSVYQRMAEYFVSYVEAHQKDYESLEQETGNIFAALAIAFEQGLHALLIRGVNAFYQFLETRGLYGQAEEHLKRAQQAALILHDDLSLSEVLLNLGKVAGKQTDYIRAEAFLQEGLALARRLDNRELISALLQVLSSIAYRLGDNTRTVLCAQEGLALARQSGDYERMSDLLKSLAAVASDLADYPRAEAYLQEGLELARQAGYVEGTRLMLTNLGWLAHQQGNYAQAEIYWQEGLALVRRIRHREGISLLLLNLGALAGDQGNYEQAEAYLQEGLILAREIGHREWISTLLANLGEYAGKQGRYSLAETYFQEGIAIARQIGHHRMLGDILSVWGELQLGRLHLDEASAAFGEALELASERSQVLAATALYGLARVAAARHNTAEAYQYGKRSLTIFEASGNYKAGEVRRWLDTLSTARRS